MCPTVPPIQVRAPPSFIKQTQDPSWKSTPKNWLYGIWRMTYTSQTYYYGRTTNLTIQYPPVLNGSWPCANQELVMLNPIADSARNYTAFAIDSPISGLNDACLVQCTGHLSAVSDHVAFLAWGSDPSHRDWVVLYSVPLPGVTTGLPAQVAIMCRNDGQGPDVQTVDGIKDALRGLGDAELTAMVDNMHPLAHDSGASAEEVHKRLALCGYNVLQNVDSLTRF